MSVSTSVTLPWKMCPPCLKKDMNRASATGSLAHEWSRSHIVDAPPVKHSKGRLVQEFIAAVIPLVIDIP